MEQVAGSLVVFFQVTSGDQAFVDSKKKKVLLFTMIFMILGCICIYVDM